MNSNHDSRYLIPNQQLDYPHPKEHILDSLPAHRRLAENCDHLVQRRPQRQRRHPLPPPPDGNSLFAPRCPPHGNCLFVPQYPPPPPPRLPLRLIMEEVVSGVRGGRMEEATPEGLDDDRRKSYTKLLSEIASEGFSHSHFRGRIG